VDNGSRAGTFSASLCFVTEAALRAQGYARFAQDQAGLISRKQLRALGVGADYVRNQIRAGRWQSWGRRVVALTTGPLSPEQVKWLAVLDGGPDCVLAGLNALERYGLTGFPSDRVQTAVPKDGSPTRHDLFVRRECRRLHAGAVHPGKRPPTMRLDVAIVDALQTMTSPLRGCALLAALVQQRIVRPESLRGPLLDAPTLRHRRTYLRVAGDIEGGAHSLTEIDFIRLAREAGIDRPIGQAVRIDRHGRRRYVDAEFRGFFVEVDGAVHLRPLAWWDDMFRQNDLVLSDKPVLRYPSVGIYLRRRDVVVQLRAAAARWPG
jgi:hypothetical protein